MALLPLSAMCNTTAVRDALLASHADVATATQQVGGWVDGARWCAL